jgi:hypothetical protein
VKCEQQGQQIAVDFMKVLPRLRALLAQDIRAAFEGDPAAKSYVCRALADIAKVLELSPNDERISFHPRRNVLPESGGSQAARDAPSTPGTYFLRCRSPNMPTRLSMQEEVVPPQDRECITDLLLGDALLELGQYPVVRRFDAQQKDPETRLLRLGQHLGMSGDVDRAWTTKISPVTPSLAHSMSMGVSRPAFLV